MVGQTRSKLRDASPDGPQSSRTGQARRRRSAGTVEPQQERSAPQERTKWSLLQHFLLGGRKLPSGARNYAARRIRNLNAQNYFPLEEVTKILLHDRFQFLHTLLDHFREKVQALQIHRFSHRTLFGVGELSLLGVFQTNPCRAFLPAQRLEGFAWVLEIWSTSVWVVEGVDGEIWESHAGNFHTSSSVLNFFFFRDFQLSGHLHANKMLF